MQKYLATYHIGTNGKKFAIEFFAERSADEFDIANRIKPAGSVLEDVVDAAEPRHVGKSSNKQPG